jgi:exodeoxyribonuclease V beta subunit
MMPPDVVEEAQDELLMEDARLLYVALTRARNRCIVLMAGRKGGAGDFDKTVGNVALARVLGADSYDAMLAAISRLTAAVPGCVTVESHGEVAPVRIAANEATVPDYNHRHFSAHIDARRMLTSFSAIKGDGGAETPEHADAAPLAVLPAPAEPVGIAAFPRGAAVGTFFHACFEHAAYDDESGWRHVVAGQLDASGLEVGRWLDTALACVGDVLKTPLAPGGPRLFGKPRDELVRECEFYFPASGVNVRALADAFASAGAPFAACAASLAALSPADFDGYLKGYIDLIFRDAGQLCILDWKSNWLGPDASAYVPASLDAAMRHSAYYLQGVIYALALRRSYAARGRSAAFESGFGGIYYVFLRGVEAGREGSGVVHFRPSAALLDGVERALGCPSVKELSQ